MVSHYHPGFEPFHKNLRCSSCGGEDDIFGPCYQCRDCPSNFTLCQECYSTENFIGSHEATHTMRVLQTPLDRTAGVWFSDPCSNCLSEEYDGTQYKCKICGYLICELCYALPENHRTYIKKKFPKCIDHDFQYSKVYERKKLSYEQFKAASIKMQDLFAHSLGTRKYDELDVDYEEEWTQLGRKIGFALYNAPSREEGQFGYTDKQEEHIIALRCHMVKLNLKHCTDKIENRKIRVNFIFISFYSADQINMLPLIRLHVWNGPTFYIEPQGRTYSSWDDFLDKNKLPDCTICIPTTGVYVLGDHGTCDLTFRGSAEQDLSRKLARTGDMVATVAGLAATGAALVSLFTPLAPFVAAGALFTGVATGAYGFGRSGYTLADRALHGESINPFTSGEAFFSWLSIVGSVFAASSAAGVAYVSRVGTAGGQVGRATQLAVNVSILGSLGVNGVGVVTSGANLFDKFLTRLTTGKGDWPTTLEIFQFTSSLLFFANAAYNVQTASRIIKTAQENALDAHRSTLNKREQKNFNRMLLKDRNEAGGSEMAGAAMTLKRLNAALAESDSIKALFGAARLSKSAGRHAAEPTSITIDGADLGTKSAAIKSAKLASESRYNGRGANEPSKTTVMFKPGHELDAEVMAHFKANNLKGTHTVTLDKPIYGYDVILDGTGKHLTQKVEVKSPTFTVIDGKSVHFNSEMSCVKPLSSFPKAMPLKVDLTTNELPIFVAPADYHVVVPKEEETKEERGRCHESDADGDSHSR